MMSEKAMFSPGMRVLCRDAEWLVTKVEVSDTSHSHFAVHCIGTDDLVRGHESVFLTQLDHLEPVDPLKTRLVSDTSSGFRMSRLVLEAHLRQMPITGFEPDLTGMGVFEPMKFQVQTVQRALEQLRPRLLLADSVGLGKTIQVGMILSELMRRGRADRILVLAKKSMLAQFQSELWNRFALPLVRLDSEGIARLRLRIPANRNPFEVYHRIIISMDTLKNVGSYRHFLEATRWDCVVIDEAHNVAGASVPERHLGYRLARLLSRRTDSLLLTTATPHNGKRETFGRLISLLSLEAIPDPALRQYSADDIKGYFFMRFKEDVREEAGENLTDRLVVPRSQTTAQATVEEERVYAILAEFRRVAHNYRHSDQPWEHRMLLQYGLYKQFLSSPESCRQTVVKRIKSLQNQPVTPELGFLRRLEKALESLSLQASSRYQVLKQQLKTIGWDGSTESPRVLVFTEYRETQDALAEALNKDFNLNYSKEFGDQPTNVLATIHGSLPDTHLMKTVEGFGTGSSKMRMLLATDVASEGINLHHQCHLIIHYDLPWSIITLIQRNGRIDRFGQKQKPVLRYLMVKTEQDIFRGDDVIFDRLIAKVEEINRSTRQGETVLKLYDPEAEERYIAESGLLVGNTDVLESPPGVSDTEAAELELLLNAANLAGQDDFLKFLLGEETPSAVQVSPSKSTPSPTTRLRLYSDKQFLLESYRFLAESNPKYLPIEEQGNLLFVHASEDLRRRLGAPDERGDVIFGSTAIPAEAWPEDNQFRLTDDPNQVKSAIQAARNFSGHWSKELLCTDQHPILKWLTERLLMLVKRGECPMVLSNRLDPGEMYFCFIGQVSSLAGAPLVADAHAVSFSKSGHIATISLSEAVERAGLTSMVNDGRSGNTMVAKALLPSAVAESRNHLVALSHQHLDRLIQLLRPEERRLKRWKERRRDLLETQIRQLGDTNPQSRKYRRQLDEIDDYVKDRQKNWLDVHFKAAAEPVTQLVLVIEGQPRL